MHFYNFIQKYILPPIEDPQDIPAQTSDGESSMEQSAVMWISLVLILPALQSHWRFWSTLPFVLGHQRDYSKPWLHFSNLNTTNIKIKTPWQPNLRVLPSQWVVEVHTQLIHHPAMLLMIHCLSGAALVTFFEFPQGWLIGVFIPVPVSPRQEACYPLHHLPRQALEVSPQALGWQMCHQAAELL